MLTTSFTTLVGCTVPIQQAGMGDVTPREMAVAVSRAGALGVVGISRLDASLDATSAHLDRLAADTAGIFGGNLLPAAAADRDLVQLVAGKARVIDFYEPPSRELVDVVHAQGALTMWQVSSAREALVAVESGCDILVAQSTEAGGHIRGELTMLPLLDEVLDAVSVPVLAAGGVGSARTLAAVLAAGAAGARLGTRFVAAAESGAHPEYVRALIAARPEDTQQCHAFTNDCPLCPASNSHRVLSSCLHAAEHMPNEIAGELELSSGTVVIPRFGGRAPSASTAGHVDAMALYAGTSVSAVRSVQPAAEIVREIAEGAERLLSRSPLAAAGGGR
jgi:enoyl-[acyl-carrier protein] reductase II